MTTAEQNAQFTAWVAEHGAVLHHVANGFAEGADRHDLMQELLLSVWKAVPAFRQCARPSTFIYRVAHNTALTWKRAQRNYRRRVDRFEALVPSECPVADPAEMGNRDGLEHLYAAIRALPPLDRSLLLLHLDGMGYAEIAEIHGLSETNVGARLSRARQKLTEWMKDLSHELR